MKIPATKIEILLGISSILQNTKRAYSAFTDFNKSISNTNAQLKSLESSSDKAEMRVKGLTSTLLGMAAAYRSIDKINSMFTSVLGGAYNYSKTLETNAVGISGILTSMVKVNGKQLEWNESMRMSVGIMNELRKQALQTSATAPELIDTFRALLGPGLGAGMKIDEIMQLTKVGVTAVKSIGLDGTQLVQELRSMIQGSIRPASSTLATALGITNTDVKNAKNSAEGLYQFLIKRLNGFEKSVQATAGTVQGRLDILKEGVYQGIEAGTQPLWKDFKDELFEISKNFLVFKNETKEISLNPKFVSNVETITDSIMKIKNGVSFITGDLTKDTGSILKALAWGSIIKLSGAALNSVVGMINKGAVSAQNYANKLSFANIELERQRKFEQALMEFSNQYEMRVAVQKELANIVNSFNKEIYGLSKRYKELGATAEQAMKMQNNIVKLINSGADAEYVQNVISAYEKASIRLKQRNDQALSAQQEKVRLEKEELEVKALKEKYEKEAIKNLLQAVSLGEKQVQEDRKHQDYINNLTGGKRTDVSLSAFGKRLQNANSSFFPEQEKIYGFLEVKKAIWRGDYESAIQQINFYDNYIAKNNELKAENERKLSIEKEIAKTQKEQYEWLNKQIQAGINIVNAKPKIDEQQQQFNIFKRSVTDSISDEKAARAAAKLSKDAQYIQSFISGKTKSKAYSTENVSMINELMKKVQEAGFSKQQSEEYAKTFINKLQRGKVSAAATKKFYDESIAQLEQIKVKYAEIKNISDKIFDRAVDAGLMKEQAQKLKEAYIKEMTSGSRESAEAWYKAFEQNIQSVQEKINGVAVGTRAGKGKVFNPNDYKTDNLAKAIAENEFDVKRSLDKFSKYSPQGVEKIKEAFLILNKALNENSIKQEEYFRIVAEYQAKITGGYMDEAVAIADVIQKQYELKNLAGDNAKKERELQGEKAKSLANTKQDAIIKEWLLNLEENYLSASKRTQIATSVAQALKGKGYTNTEKAIKRLLDIEEKMAKKIKETGQIAPPVYKEILAMIEKLKNSTSDLTKEEMKHIDAIVKKGKEYTRLENILEVGKKGSTALFASLTSVGFVMQSVGTDASTTAGKFAEFAIQVGFVGSTVFSLTDNLKDLWETIKLMKIAGAFKVLGIGGLVGGVAAGIYAYKEGLSLEEIKRRYFEGDKKKVEQGRYLESIYEGEDFEYSDWSEKNNGRVDFSGTEVINPPTDEEDSEAKKIEKLNKKISEAKASYKILSETIDMANGKLTGSYSKYQESIDASVKKTDEWKKMLNSLVAKAGGVLDKDGNIISFGEIGEEQYNRLIIAMERYMSLSKEQAKQSEDIKSYSNQLQIINNLESLGELSAIKAAERRENTLAAEISYYEQLLQTHNYCEDEKLKYETVIADKRKQLREEEAKSGKLVWDDVLNHIKGTTFDQTAVVKSAYDSMLNTFTSFGQNMFTESKSLSERMKDMFKDFTNTIWNMMMKLIMQGLAMKAILGLTNMLGNSGGTSSIGFASNESIMDGAWGDLNARPFASGGYAKGWAIVGEQGPELVNFSTPGRVYNAEQTARALSGSSPTDVKVVIENRTNQQVKATNATAKFDGKSLILGVVIDAVRTNDGGFNNLLKGAIANG